MIQSITLNRITSYIGGLAICVIASLAANPLTAYAEHPIHGHQANPRFDDIYCPDRTYPVEWTTGDLTFVEKLPEPSSLTEEEKYIIAGSVSSAYSNKAGLAPWKAAILSIVTRHYNEYGFVPGQLTPDVIRRISGCAKMSDDQLDEFRNPLTDEWPLIQARQHSPGDVYMRALKEDEILHFAKLNPAFEMMWIENRHYNPETNKDDLYLKPSGPIFYMRIYGWSEVIHNSFQAVYVEP